ncbi:MAG: hypothetical protein IJV65_10150 [Kiritimatiellae bacterium]|nr:hypothetical protein [Kiritimatiellia bacterium]
MFAPNRCHRDIDTPNRSEDFVALTSAVSTLCRNAMKRPCAVWMAAPVWSTALSATVIPVVDMEWPYRLVFRHMTQLLQFLAVPLALALPFLVVFAVLGRLDRRDARRAKREEEETRRFVMDFFDRSDRNAERSSREFFDSVKSFMAN